MTEGLGEIHSRKGMEHGEQSSGNLFDFEDRMLRSEKKIGWLGCTILSILKLLVVAPTRGRFFLNQEGAVSVGVPLLVRDKVTIN